MYLLDNDLVKEHIADIYREVEQEQLARAVTAGQPTLQERLRVRLGNALIELGNRVKAQTLPAALVPECDEQWG